MKRIRLTNIGYALVDDEDYETMTQFTWHLAKNGYVRRSGANRSSVYMHRLIMDAPKGMDVDHIDMNKVNNQKSNLRIATRSQNMANMNRAKKATAHSKYKGVSKLNRENLKKCWLAYIKVNYKTHYLGYFATEKEAAQAYNNAAIEFYCDNAQLNIIA